MPKRKFSDENRSLVRSYEALDVEQTLALRTIINFMMRPDWVDTNGGVRVGAGSASIGTVVLGAGSAVVGSITNIDGLSPNLNLYQPLNNEQFCQQIRNNIS